MSRTSKLRKQVARGHSWRTGTGDFEFHRHIFTVLRGAETHSSHLFERDALEYMALANDPELRLEKTPWLIRRTAGPLFDDEPAPPTQAKRGDPS